jgi:hypothetical protein
LLYYNYSFIYLYKGYTSYIHISRGYVKHKMLRTTGLKHGIVNSPFRAGVNNVLGSTCMQALHGTDCKHTAQKTTNELTFHICSRIWFILQLALVNQKKFILSFHSFLGRTKLTDHGFIFHSLVQHVSSYMMSAVVQHRIYFRH